MFRAHAQRVHDALHRGVVGGLLALTQRERALPRTVVRIVPFGRDDPPGPPDLVEVYVHLVLGTRAAVSVAANVIHSLAPRPLSLPLLAASRPRLPPSSLSALRRGAREGRGRVGTGTCTLVQHQDGLAEVDVSAETGRRGFRDFRFRFCRPGFLLWLPALSVGFVLLSLVRVSSNLLIICKREANQMLNQLLFYVGVFSISIGKD